MNAQEPPKKRLVELLWLTSSDTVTVRLEDSRLVVRTGPYPSQERLFSCRSAQERRLAKILRLMDLLLDEADSDDDD